MLTEVYIPCSVFFIKFQTFSKIKVLDRKKSELKFHFQTQKSIRLILSGVWVKLKTGKAVLKQVHITNNFVLTSLVYIKLVI